MIPCFVPVESRSSTTTLTTRIRSPALQHEPQRQLGLLRHTRIAEHPDGIDPLCIGPVLGLESRQVGRLVPNPTRRPLNRSRDLERPGCRIAKAAIVGEDEDASAAMSAPYLIGTAHHAPNLRPPRLCQTPHHLIQAIVLQGGHVLEEDVGGLTLDTQPDHLPEQGAALATDHPCPLARSTHVLAGESPIHQSHSSRRGPSQSPHIVAHLHRPKVSGEQFPARSVDIAHLPDPGRRTDAVHTQCHAADAGKEIETAHAHSNWEGFSVFGFLYDTLHMARTNPNTACLFICGAPTP